jgi:E3 SUMO-protein ligase PIAS1
MLVETTPVDHLVSTLKSASYRSSQDIRQKSECISDTIYSETYTVFVVIESLSEDDDIIAGPQKMSLKCPVGGF